MDVDFAMIIPTSNKAKIANCLFGTAQHGKHGGWRMA